MAGIPHWKNLYSRNVHEFFWPLLEEGIAWTRAVDIDADADLFPETIVYASTNRLIDLIDKKENISDFDELMKKLDTNDPIYLAFKADKRFHRVVRKYCIMRSTEPFKNRIRKRRAQGVNTFAQEVRNLFDEAVNQSRVVELAEIATLSMNHYDDSFEGDVRCDDDSLVPEHYTKLEEQLREVVLGQDGAVGSFVDGIFEGELLRGTKASPLSTFLFVGPPGVGKTYLATSAAKALGRPYKIFQMNEYADDNSFQGLVGFERTWKNAQPGSLTTFVRDNKRCVLIFDEAEKAHLNTVRQFLSILEGGFLQDLYYNAEIDFTETICIFTTNAGRDFFEDNRDRMLSSLSETTLIDALKHDRNAQGEPTLPTELLSRLAKGHIIGFDHMDPIKLRPIIRNGIDEGMGIYEKRLGLNIELDSDIKTKLVHLLMFHLGAELDARVASSRSRAFIIDLVYSLIGAESSETPTQTDQEPEQSTWEDTVIRIGIDEDDPLAHRCLSPAQKMKFIAVARKDIQDKLEKRAAEPNAHFEIVQWWNKDSKKCFKNIESLLEQHALDGILVDPLFWGKDGQPEYEGVIQQHTMANDLLRWLAKRDDVPPVFGITSYEKSALNYSFTQRDEYRKLGVRGFRPASPELINELALELSLEKNLASLMSSGRSLDFEANYKKTANGYELIVCGFKLVASMSSKAADIFVNENEGESENGFDHVIGAESAKRELRRFKRFLEDPEEYQRSGQKVSKGILLWGPPGTGKTMLAKALASEADCPFIQISGADVTTSAPQSEGDKVTDIKGLFRLARKYAPSVLFIDEIDAFARSREYAANENNISKVNKMLTEMDGFSSHAGKPVFVIAATNADPSLLDAALLRRFTKKVYVGMPSLSDRLEFLKLSKKQLARKKYGLDSLDDDMLENFARLTACSSLAEISNAIQLAQGKAAEQDSDCLDYETLRDCYEEIAFGEKIPDIEETLKSTAYHEAGHAFMSFEAGERFEPEYATVVGRGNFLGMVMPQENTHHHLTRQDLISKIRISLAGQAATIVFGGDDAANTGASKDLEHATQAAIGMVCRYGLGDGILISVDPDTILNGPLAETYHDLINKILVDEFEYTVEHIREHRDAVKRLSDKLLEQSRLETEEMREIIYKAD